MNKKVGQKEKQEIIERTAEMLAELFVNLVDEKYIKKRQRKYGKKEELNQKIINLSNNDNE